MKKIYLLKHTDPSYAATTDFIQGDPFNTLPARRCPACGGPVSMRPWAPPFRAELATWGKRFGDMAFGPGGDILISERFKDLWLKSGLIGLEGFEPVEIVKVVRRGKRFKDAPPAYFRVVAQPSQAAFDSVASGEQWLEPSSPRCEVCREGGNSKGWERIVLEEEPRENICTVRGFGEVLVDEHFKRFIEENGLLNCPLVPAEEAAHWF
ncbi:MAG: hypothetical protein JNJ46_05520 [Myxococcales bacterium]|nr:hypothetical protein [Myxococcales bacterium]